MSKNKIFADIIPKLTSKYNIKFKLLVTYRFIENDKYLYIILKYFKNTDYNPYPDKDIYFSITLDDKFPESLPIVKSLSNFSFPSLYDNSDLYRNILLFQISDELKKKDDGFNIVEDIIVGLKPFLEKIKKNEEKKIFYYYGEYILDEIYDINSFFNSSKNELFRANQIINNNNKNKKYIILNDVYFLLFDPVPDVNNYAKLIFISDIMLLSKVKQEKNEKKIIMEFRDSKYKNNEVIKLCFEFEKKYEEFLVSKNQRIDKLKKIYDIFDTMDGKDNNGIEYNTKGLQISKSFESDL